MLGTAPLIASLVNQDIAPQYKSPQRALNDIFTFKTYPNPSTN